MDAGTPVETAPRLRGRKLVVRYAAFAAISILVNLAVQAVVFSFYHGAWDLEAGLAAGTIAGLVTKFFLDKHWIFYDTAPQALHSHGIQFFFYTLMGVATTVIFWGFEYAFDWIFGGDEARLVGGAIGLTIGYVVKYHLDRVFVFRRSNA